MAARREWWVCPPPCLKVGHEGEQRLGHEHRQSRELLPGENDPLPRVRGDALANLRVSLRPRSETQASSFVFVKVFVSCTALVFAFCLVSLLDSHEKAASNEVGDVLYKIKRG